MLDDDENNLIVRKILTKDFEQIVNFKNLDRLFGQKNDLHNMQSFSRAISHLYFNNDIPSYKGLVGVVNDEVKTLFLYLESQKKNDSTNSFHTPHFCSWEEEEPFVILHCIRSIYNFGNLKLNALGQTFTFFLEELGNKKIYKYYASRPRSYNGKHETYTNKYVPTLKNWKYEELEHIEAGKPAVSSKAKFILENQLWENEMTVFCRSYMHKE
jgi:hypothetical protein